MVRGNGSARAETSVRAAARPNTIRITMRRSPLRDTLDDDLATITISGSYTASTGSITAADPASVTPVANGTAGYFRVATSGGTGIIDGTVTATGGGGDMQLGSTTIATGTPLDLGVPSFTVPVS